MICFAFAHKSRLGVIPKTGFRFLPVFRGVCTRGEVVVLPLVDCGVLKMSDLDYMCCAGKKADYSSIKLAI